MKKSNNIIINGLNYNEKEIISSTTASRNSFEKQTLEFCRKWLMGDTLFPVSTSGSTGTPKRIVLTRKQMIANANRIKKTLDLQPGQTALLCLHPQYIAGTMMLARSLSLKLNLYAVEPSRNPFEGIPEHVTIDFASFVPYQLKAILESKGKKKLDTMHCALVGGSPIDSSLHESIPDTPCRLYASYGMTETAATIALQRLNGSAKQTHFHTLPGIKISQGEQGCLVVEVDYLEQPVVTNDLVEIKNRTTFRWIGRKDHIINSGGLKIIPEQLESPLIHIFDALKLKNRFFITGLPDRSLGEKIILLIEGTPFPNREENTILEKIKNLSQPYLIPKEICFIEHFIETASGKIDRKKTKKQYFDTIGTGT